MKNKFKRLSKRTKIALVGTVLYAAALASPIYAATEEAQPVAEAQPQVEKTLDQYSALELKAKYEEDLYEATKDKMLIGPEIENLHKLMSKYLEVKKKEHSDLLKGDTNVTDMDPSLVGTIDLIIKDFEKDILVYYPGLCSGNQGYLLKYDAFNNIKEVETFKSLLNRAYELKKGGVLENLLKKETYEVKDLVIFKEILDSYAISRDLAYNKDIIKPSEATAEQVKRIVVKRLSLPDDQLEFIRDSYKHYLDAMDKEHAKSKKYFSAGVDMDRNNKYLGVGQDNNFFKDSMVDNLEGLIQLQGYQNVEIKPFYYGIKWPGKFPKIPMWAWLASGLIFPFVRTGFTAKYMNRKYDSLDLGGNFMNILLGTIAFDGLHPLVFPARIFLVPFVEEPIRKIFKIYNVN